MDSKMFFAFCTFVLAASFFACTNGIAVMSVDIGSEWFKVAIVSPGVPMEIALNKESKRKTPMTISYRHGERSFGEDAQIAGLKSPKDSPSYFLDLVGKTIDNPIVRLFQERFPYYDIVSDDERNVVAFRMENNVTYTPEELLAQILHKSRSFAEISVGQKIKDVVVTVPAYFNQAERRSVAQAVELADLKLLQLFNDNTAIALNYGIFRRKALNDTITYVMFYDMGASSTTATIVGYKNVKSKEKGFTEVIPQASVLGVGYDRTLGGLEIQIRLRNYLATEFDKLGKTPNSVFKNPRAMAKLFKEAGRVKNVLSANNDHYAQVEGLIDEKDFRLQVSREKLEELAADVFERIGAPIRMALETSALSMDLISQVVLVGAGTRMPKIQDKLTEIVKTELAKNINTDEAVVLGAAYKAADLSQGFKVMKFITKDMVLFPIQIVFDRAVDGRTKQVRKTLFSKVNSYPQKKIITFNKHTEDFGFGVEHAELDHLPSHEVEALGNLNLSYVTLAGVAAAYEKHAQLKAESKGIRAHFSIDESGLLNLQNVELVSEKSSQNDEEEGTFSKLGSTISKLFSGSNDADVTEKEEVSQKEDVKPTSEANPDGTGTSQDEKAKSPNKTTLNEEKVANETEKVVKKPTITTIKEKIAAEEVKLGPALISGKKLEESIEKIQALNNIDAERARRETALNNLEAFVIDAQSKITTDEYRIAGTEDELESITKKCSEIQEWLYEDGFDATAETYEEKLESVKKLTTKLYWKVYEIQERPELLKALLAAVDAGKAILNSMKQLNAAAEEIFTVPETENLEKVINRTQELHDTIKKAAAETPLNQALKWTSRDLNNQLGALDREMKHLVHLGKIRKSKQKPVVVAANETKTSTNETEELPITTEESSAVNQTDSQAKEFEKETASDGEIPLSESPQIEIPLSEEEQIEIADSETTKFSDDKNETSSHEEL